MNLIAPAFGRVLIFLIAASAAAVAEADEAAARRKAADELIGRGLRRIASTHLVLYTDLEADPAIDELADVFDLAVPQWCEFCGIDVRRTADWQLTGYLIGSRERLQQVGLLPADLPPFLHGYQRGDELWLYEQPSDYYRRHLLLHEGTHGFMNHFLGGTGPPWFMEGIAEYLGTHSWQQGQLKLAYVPRTRQESPHWGRVKIIKDDVAAGRPLSLADVMEYGPRAHLQVEPYGWSWAAVLLLAEHPDFRDALLQSLTHVTDTPSEFNRQLRSRMGARWPEAELNWQVLLQHMDYGYDVRRAAVQLADEKQLPSAGLRLTISAERGWQSTGILLQRGQSYEISAAGRYTIAGRDPPWPCEPGGITIRYYQGKPLGQLLAAVVPDDHPAAIRRPLAVGLQTTITASETGWLNLCVNENPADLVDNEGQIQVQVKCPGF